MCIVYQNVVKITILCQLLCEFRDPPILDFNGIAKIFLFFDYDTMVAPPSLTVTKFNVV